MPLLSTHLSAALIPLSLKGILVGEKSQPAIGKLKEAWVLVEQE